MSPMQLLIVEDLTSGALPLEGSQWQNLAGEGAAMLCAIAEDARDLPETRVEVLWSRKLGPFPIPGVTVHQTDSTEHEQQLFAELARRADRTFVIAPEFERRLEKRREMVERAGGEFVGSSIEALALCGDKLRLAEHLRQQAAPSIPTRRFDVGQAEEELRRARSNGLVIKPRDGAGAMDTFHVREADALRKAASKFDETGGCPIVQPFIPGRAISIAAIVSSRRIELFPPASQQIEYGEQLAYTGGSVGCIPRDSAIESLVRATLETVPGLSGYIGVDLILPSDESPPLIVEINPRLTTSYLGYRQLAVTNLAPRLLDPNGDYQAIEWRSERINFATHR